jgi:hypothetical protein
VTTATSTVGFDWDARGNMVGVVPPAGDEHVQDFAARDLHEWVGDDRAALLHEGVVHSARAVREGFTYALDRLPPFRGFVRRTAC